MTHYDPPKITPEQRSNLLKLADFLEHFEEKNQFRSNFSMSVFSEFGNLYQQREVSCGSVGCAVGHGPSIGITKEQTEDWEEYSHRVFGITGEDWGWCFSGSWENADNTTEGAAKRIRILLNLGRPVKMMSMLTKVTPLCYK